MSRVPAAGLLAGCLPRVFAHRCGGALAPENTLAGLRIAAQRGCTAVEFDVMLSADGSPWLIHDETLERTTNGTGRLCDAHDVDLARLDAGCRHHPAFRGEPLPTLRAAALLCRELGLLANVEIKPATGFEVLTGEVVARQVLELWQGGTPPLLSSFSGSALEAARRVAPQIPMGCLWGHPPADWLARLNALNAHTLHCSAGAISDQLLAVAKSNGVPVLCYTVNNRVEAEALWQRGVASVFSDRIDRIACPV